MACPGCARRCTARYRRSSRVARPESLCVRLRVAVKWRAASRGEDGKEAPAAGHIAEKSILAGVDMWLLDPQPEGYCTPLLQSWVSIMLRQRISSADSSCTRRY